MQILEQRKRAPLAQVVALNRQGKAEVEHVTGRGEMEVFHGNVSQQCSAQSKT